MIVDRLVRALDDRLRTAPLVRRALHKVFPDHWSFMLGEIALYAFVVLVLTGVYLTLFFDPSTAETVYQGGYAPLNGSRTSAAYASTVRLSFDIRSGLLMRQTHHWAALVFVGAIVLHLLRIFFTGAFRKPREINWLIGVTMLALALANGFTGYSIPDDLLSGTGLRIIYSVILSIPWLGDWIAFLMFGGEFPTEEMIPRMYVTHVLIVPVLLAVLIATHLGILVRQKHSQFPGPGYGERNVVGSRLWPSYTVRTLSLFAWVLAVLFLLGGLAQINPVWLYGPFEPAQVTSPAQPDWYVAWGDGALRLFPAVEFTVFGHLVPAPFFPGVVVGLLTFAGLYLWPFAERWFVARGSGTRAVPHQLLDRPRQHPVRIGFGVGALAFYTVLLVAAADDIIAKVLQVSMLDVLSVLRVLVLVLPVPVGVVAYLVTRALRDRADPGAVPDPSARIELWREWDGTWRWRYRAGETVLVGNRAYLDRSEAEEAAGTAYPGLPQTEVEPPAAARSAAISTAARTMGRRAGTVGGWLALAAFGAWRRRRQRRRGR
jgi:ubiquinol-cytochrome c reductase cytochrome b subunit